MSDGLLSMPGGMTVVALVLVLMASGVWVTQSKRSRLPRDAAGLIIWLLGAGLLAAVGAVLIGVVAE